MIESGPVESAFNAIQEITDLKIVSDLTAANKLGKATVEIVSGDIQAAARPRPAEIAAEIKSRPVVRRYYGNGRWRRFDRHVGGVGRNARANCNYASKNQVFHSPQL